MALEKNRGGTWNTLEQKARACDRAVYVIRCTYNDLLDPRIPIGVEGWLYSISTADFDSLAGGNNFTTAAARGDVLLNMGTGASIYLGATITDVASGGFQQQPFHMVPPTERFLVDLTRLRFLATTTTLPNDWRIEDQPAFELKPWDNDQQIGNTGTYVRFERLLPPAAARPNAWFDYLALQGKLNQILYDRIENQAFVLDARRINTDHDTRNVPGAYRALLLSWNRYCLTECTGITEAYRSEAPDDQSELGCQLTIAPEIDHIVPFAAKGPTVFSNLRVTSRAYNGSRGDAVEARIANQLVKVGHAVRMTVKRDRKPPPNDDYDTGPARKKGKFAT
jgi:hypothetical protein